MRRPGLSRIVLLIVLWAGVLFAVLPLFGQQNQSPAPAEVPASQASPSPGLDLTPDAKGGLSQLQMQNLRQIVMDHYRANYAKQRDYTYVVRRLQNKFDGKGEIKSSESKTYEVMELYGEQVEQLIAKDDKPLSGKEASKERERINKVTDKRKNESEEERTERQAEEERQRQTNREFVREVADAYDFRLVGSETLNGRDTWVIAGEPRPGFQAHLKEAEILPKYHGRLWIDKSDLQLAKIDAEAIDTVSFGWGLVRVHKGTRLVIERTRVNGEVWLPLHVSLKLDARLALFKSYNEEDDDAYRDYKKFRATTKIVSVGEVKP